MSATSEFIDDSKHLKKKKKNTPPEAKTYM